MILRFQTLNTFIFYFYIITLIRQVHTSLIFNMVKSGLDCIAIQVIFLLYILLNFKYTKFINITKLNKTDAIQCMNYCVAGREKQPIVAFRVSKVIAFLERCFNFDY